MRGVLGFLSWAGRSSRGGDLLFLHAQEKYAKEVPPATRVPSLRCGQLAVLDHRAGPQNSLRAWQRFAQTAAASQITKQMRPTAHLSTLRSVRLGTGRRGQ